MSQSSRPLSLGPVLLWAGYVLTTAWALALRFSIERSGPGPVLARPFFLRPFAFGLGLMLANAITFRLSLRIRRDFVPGSGMRAAWGLMAAASACGFVQYGETWVALMAGLAPVGGPGGALPPGFRMVLMGGQVAGLLGVLLLVGSLIRMRSSFVRLGLGRLRLVDRVALAAIAVATPLLFGLRESKAPEVLTSPVIQGLQRFDPLLIAGCAIACVVLFRISRDLGRGSLAISFYYVALLGLIRLVALLSSRIPIPGFHVPFTAASVASDWLITLAVFYRWQLTGKVGEMVARYEAPEIPGRVTGI